MIYCDDTARCWPTPVVGTAVDAVLRTVPDPNALRTALATGAYELRVQAAPWPCSYDTSVTCAGEYHAQWGEIDVEYDECMPQSGLVHELVHLYQLGIDRQVYRDNAGAHSDPHYYSSACSIGLPPPKERSGAQIRALRLCEARSLNARANRLVRLSIWCVPRL